MIRNEIKKIIEKAIKEEFGKIKIPEIKVEKPENRGFGDYSSNIALQLVKVLKKDPLEIAKKIKSEIIPPRPAAARRSEAGAGLFEKIEVAKPGFINFYLSKEYLQKQVGEILKKKEGFGDLNIGKNKKVHPVKSRLPGKIVPKAILQGQAGISPEAKLFNRVNVEFISANPTGPLTLGNGRGGFCGDVLAKVLERAGYEVTREYYINDVGEQIKKLGEGSYDKLKEVKDIRKRVREKDHQKAGDKMAQIIVKEIIKPTVKKMGIKFDVWFSEKSLYENKEVDKILNFLKKKKLAYEKDGALWFKSSQFGDDKDRVLVKADGEKTYLASDIAYLKNKFERGFDKLIYFWGADHYGYVERIKAAAEALGYKKEQVDIIIMQLVAVMWTGEGEKELKRMSKRKGIYWDLDKLILELKKDVVRFFFLTRSPGSHLIFDLELAKEQSQKNPVFYIQYAHARICSILRKAGPILKKPESSNLTIVRLLDEPSELDLIRQLIRLPEIIEDTAKDYQVQRLPNYALELVTAFHKFYEECRVLPTTLKQSKARYGASKNLTQARLGLVLATKIVLKNLLDLMGISAPERM